MKNAENIRHDVMYIKQPIYTYYFPCSTGNLDD